LDPDFVPQQRYAELLVAEIPTGQRLEVFLNTYRSKDAWVPSNLRHFFDALFVQLNAEELKQVYEVISEELKSVEDESVIRQIIGSFSASIWPLLDEVARLRIENRLIRSIREGQYDRRQKRCRGGALGTWAKSLFPHFLLKTEAIRAISDKLNSSSAEDQDYVLEYFYYHLDSLAKPMPPTFERTLKRMLKAGNGRVFDAMLIGGWSYDTWTDDLRKAYDEFSIVAEVDPDPDDIPF